MSIRDELERIYETNGVLTPEAVVDDARPDDAPLHSHFEWDDALAGEQYRLVQARHLIRTVTVEAPSSALRVPQQVRMFHNVSGDEPGQYVSLRALTQAPALADEVLAQAEREWRALKAKYSALRGFLQMVEKDLAA